jgi:hypothetical protein
VVVGARGFDVFGRERPGTALDVASVLGDDGVVEEVHTPS